MDTEGETISFCDLEEILTVLGIYKQESMVTEMLSYNRATFVDLCVLIRIGII